MLRAQVEYVGRCSLEVGVRVYAEKPATGERALTLSSHLVFVKVDEHGKPLPVPQAVMPRGAEEEALHAAAGERRARRLERFERRAERMREVDDDATPEQLRWTFESCRSVLPEDLLFGNTMFAGKLLLDIDEAGGILSMRYCRGLVMTACLDALDFYAPIHANEVVTFKAGLNHVGTTSLEIGVKVLSEVPWTGEIQARLHRLPLLRAPGLGSERPAASPAVPAVHPRDPGRAAPLRPGARAAGPAAGAGQITEAAIPERLGDRYVWTFTVVADQAEEGQDGRPAREALLEDPARDHRRGQERRRRPQGQPAPEGGHGVGAGGQHARRQHQARHPEGHRRAPGRVVRRDRLRGLRGGRGGGDGADPHRQQEPHRPRDPAHLREERGPDGHRRLRGLDVRPPRDDRGGRAEGEGGRPAREGPRVGGDRRASGRKSVRGHRDP